jgi:RNA polymerase sigma-70 factor (ECF subfamily)
MTDEDVLAVYRSTVDEVFRYASRLTGGDRPRTEELVQDTYLAFIRHRRARPDAELSAGWLIVTCRNRFLDQLRRDRRRTRRERAAVVVRESDGADPDPLELLGGLPGHQRAALLLRYVDGLTVPEIAQALGRSIHATESLLARSRAKVRRLHTQLEDES